MSFAGINEKTLDIKMVEPAQKDCDQATKDIADLSANQIRGMICDAIESKNIVRIKTLFDATLKRFSEKTKLRNIKQHNIQNAFIGNSWMMVTIRYWVS